MKIKRSPFSFSEKWDFSSFWTVLKDPVKTFHSKPHAQLNSLLHKSPLCQFHPAPALKTDLLQHHRANICTPCRYQLRGTGKPVLGCQRAALVHLQSRACGSRRLGGKEERHKEPQSCFVGFKSVSELPLHDLQSHRHVAASFSLGHRVWGHRAWKWDPERKVCQLQENFLTSL